MKCTHSLHDLHVAVKQPLIGPPPLYVPCLLATAKAILGTLDLSANNCQLHKKIRSYRSLAWYYSNTCSTPWPINFISIYFVCFKNDLFSHV